MNCESCEQKMSEYIEGALAGAERTSVDLHLQSCPACTQLMASMTEVLEWAATFPVHSAPSWLPTRILANTPNRRRETWRDTFSIPWRRILEPRPALAFFTATLVLGWMGSQFGVGLNSIASLRDPSAVVYRAEGLLNRAYDQAVRAYYQSPVVAQIHCRIEQIREIS